MTFYDSFRVVRYYPMGQDGLLEIGETLVDGVDVDTAFEQAKQHAEAEAKMLYATVIGGENGYQVVVDDVRLVNYVVYDDSEVEYTSQE